MRALASRLGQQPVLAVGRGEVVGVAAGYGFRKVVSTRQLAAACPGALPFLTGNASPQPGGQRVPLPCRRTKGSSLTHLGNKQVQPSTFMAAL